MSPAGCLGVQIFKLSSVATSTKLMYYSYIHQNQSLQYKRMKIITHNQTAKGGLISALSFHNYPTHACEKRVKQLFPSICQSVRKMNQVG